MFRYLLILAICLISSGLPAYSQDNQLTLDEILSILDDTKSSDLRFIGKEDPCVSLPVCLEISCTVYSVYEDRRTKKKLKIESGSGRCGEWYGQCLCLTL